MDNVSIETVEELDEAIELMETEPVKKEVPESQAVAQDLQSPTLEPVRRPKVKTACESCPNAMWLSSPEDV